MQVSTIVWVGCILNDSSIDKVSNNRLYLFGVVEVSGQLLCRDGCAVEFA